MQFVQPLKSEFTCKLCSEAWDPEAVTRCADCESNFCKACYDEAMMKGEKCHACAKQPATFGNVHMLVRSMASNLHVFCRYKAHGCDWRGIRSAHAAHGDACPKKPKEFSYVDESAIPAELVCPVCHSALVDPVQLPCEHVFCRVCITEAMKRAPDGQPECPVDRSRITHESLTQPPKFISEILDEIPVFCAHRNAARKGEGSSCQWTGRRRDYIGHRACCKGGVAPTPSSGKLAQDKEVDAVPTPAPVQKPKVVVVSPTDTKRAPPSAASTDRLDITTLTEYPFIAAGDTQQDIYALAHLKAPHLTSLEQRKKPLSISAVIDVSGSMAGGKLQMAQESLKFMIDELTDRDELGIIAFHTTVEQTVCLTKMNAVGKQRAREAVAALIAKSCTNLSGGLFAGMSQLERKGFAPADFDNYFADGTCKHPGSPFNRIAGLDARPTDAPLLLKSASFSVTHYGTAMARDGIKRYTYGCELTLNAQASALIHSVTMTGTTNALGAKTFSACQDRQRLSGPRPTPIEGVRPQTVDPKKYTWETDRPEVGLLLTVNFKREYASSLVPLHHTIDLTQGDFGTCSVPFPQPAATTTTDSSVGSESCRAVMLFTDGAANGGITKEEALKAVMRQRLQSCPDTVVHTFGFGADHNARLLQGLAEIASGSYYFIQDVSTLKESFADCLGGLMSTVAQNIQLTIHPRPGFIVDKILSSYPVTVVAGASVVTMRDLYSAEQRDVLVRLKMVEANAVGTEAQMVTFEVKYDSLLSGGPERVEAVACTHFSGAQCTDAPNPSVDEQRARIAVTEALQAARAEADSGNVAGARYIMETRRQSMSAKQSNPSPYFDAMMADMRTVEAQMTTTNRWASGGSKECAQVKNCHGQQRMNNCAQPAAQVEALGYDNSWKKSMRAKSHK